jgi:DNA-binding transcriptional regulator GbsR (MarR family)
MSADGGAGGPGGTAPGDLPAVAGAAEPDIDWRLRFVEDFGGLVLVYGTPRAVMRVLGWMVVCDPPEQTAQEIQDRLTLSAGSVSSAVRTLGEAGMLERVARPGDRHIYYRLCAHGWERVLELRFRAFTEIRRVAHRALEGGQEECDRRMMEMRDTFAHIEAGVTALLRESLERGHIDTPPAGTTFLRRDA